MIILIQEYFESNNIDRSNEIKTVLEFNLNNPNIDYIYLLNEKDEPYIRNLEQTNNKLHQIVTGSRLTFKKAFEIANFFTGHIIIIANNDITFTKIGFPNVQTFENIKKLTDKGVVLATTRHNFDNLEIEGREFSQDSWIFRSPILIPDDTDFYFGKLSCDTKIAYLLSQFYIVKNYPYDIITLHLHKSNIRTYSEDDRIHGPYKTLPFEKLDNIENFSNYKNKNKHLSIILIMVLFLIIIFFLKYL